MWTLSEVTEFLKDCQPVYPGGASKLWNYSIEEKSDGDVWYRIILPFWSQNSVVAQKVLEIALKASKEKDTIVFLKGQGLESAIWLNFYVSVCDPD